MPPSLKNFFPSLPAAGSSGTFGGPSMGGASQVPNSSQAPRPNIFGSIGNFFSNAYAKGNQELYGNQSSTPTSLTGGFQNPSPLNPGYKSPGSLVNKTGVGGALPTPETGGQSLGAVAQYKPQPSPIGSNPDPLPSGTNTGNGQLPASGMYGSFMQNPANAQSQQAQAQALAKYDTTTGFVTDYGKSVGANPVQPNDPASQQNSQQNNQPGQSGGNSLLSSFGNNPANQQYLQQQTDTLTKLGALQGQLAQLGVQSPQEVGLQQMINQTQNTLNNSTPNQYLKDNPGLTAGGITENQLERTTQQANLPLSQSLANYVLAKSAITQTRTNQQQAVGAQATGLGAQADIQNQIRQLTMFGGLPPDVASAIIQKQLFPPYQTYTNLAGMPGVVSEGAGGTFSSQLLGSGAGGIGSPGQGGNTQGGSTQGGTGAGGGQQSQGGQYRNFTQQIQQQAGAIDITGTGLPVAMNYMANGTPYIAQDKIDPRLSGLVQSLGPSMGIPVLNTEQVSKVQSIDVTKQNLDQLSQTVNGQNGQGGILSGGLYGRTVGAGLNTLSDLFQTNPEISAFKTYRDTAINTIQALAGGSGSGFRLNQGEINTAVSNLPSLTDNLETANKKLSLLNGFLDKWSSELVGKQATAPSSSNSQSGGGQSGGGGIYNF